MKFFDALGMGITIVLGYSLISLIVFSAWFFFSSASIVTLCFLDINEAPIAKKVYMIGNHASRKEMDFLKQTCKEISE